MFREIITPVTSDVVLHLPNEMIGKSIEIVANEVLQEEKSKSEILKSDLSAEEKEREIKLRENFLETFGSGRDSSININEIKNRAWRKYSW